MNAGEFVVADDSGDVVLVFADHAGDVHQWAIQPSAALDLAARLMVKAYKLDPNL